VYRCGGVEEWRCGSVEHAHTCTGVEVWRSGSVECTYICMKVRRSRWNTTDDDGIRAVCDTKGNG
jgi:hypothetical protein